jgi:hypothetical protein
MEIRKKWFANLREVRVKRCREHFVYRKEESKIVKKQKKRLNLV